ncbi:diguanylate cyclase [[Brevibacterium] frigoritolerans]|uniref:Diguanylate cyclase n=1 Tax=Peribacillus frigoritolerans TaxID=450367 RepID=A0A941J5M6_9BACI|nr:diguanylate cyclase [Peribacillus frigoritolerans]
MISHAINLEKGIIRDPLSGLYNRNFIYNYFDYHQDKTNDEMALLYIDLDHFKFLMIPLDMILVTASSKRLPNVFANRPRRQSGGSNRW